MHIFNTVLLALLGGILPALAWLSFWLREDVHPEPKKLIFKSFLYGMAAVPFALVFQFIINFILIQGKNIEYVFFTNFPIAILAIVLWAGSEEYFKYKAAQNSALKTPENDEPVDPMIYMITAALGFAALENTLFIFWPLLAGDSTTAFMTGNMRFIGSTMLHVATSAIIGIFASFSFYKNKELKKKNIILGFIVAVSLHTLFNSFIIRSEEFTVFGFATVWLTIILIILFFEKVKKIYITRQSQK
jgi:RsiW-degrading membrane proteinase PrsW (M82 family)